MWGVFLKRFIINDSCMHIVVYKFSPKEGEEDNFVACWAEVTKQIFRYRGSLGSRLHKDDAGNWIAYAQWPSREIFADSKFLPRPPDLNTALT